jgi:hypothetical protein
MIGTGWRFARVKFVFVGEYKTAVVAWTVFSKMGLKKEWIWALAGLISHHIELILVRRWWSLFWLPH